VKPDIVVDVGNSRIKWGRVVPGGIGEMAAFPHDDTVGWKRQLVTWFSSPAQKWAVAGVHPRQIERFRTWVEARHSEVTEITTDLLIEDPTRFGVRVDVDEPGRVGVDRLLTALAAIIREPADIPTAVINVGTAMTVDFVDKAGRFVGGAILPGPRLMARSLHDHTAKLPSIDIAAYPRKLVFGANTADAIAVGIAAAVIGAADQLVWDWATKCNPPPNVFITGGDSGYFLDFYFTADTNRVVIDPMLTLDGIRIAAEALP
jgi:type III pantothenate kinase